MFGVGWIYSLTLGDDFMTALGGAEWASNEIPDRSYEGALYKEYQLVEYQLYRHSDRSDSTM